MQMRRLLILLLSLWLPLQGLAGMLSPQCPHHAAASHRGTDHGAIDHAAMDHLDHTAHPVDPLHGHGQTGDAAQCDHCEPCHLGSGFLLASLLTVAAPPPESFGAAATDHHLPMVFIDGPHRPPRSALA